MLSTARAFALFRLAVCQYELSQTLGGFAFYIGKGGHGHASFRYLLGNGFLVRHGTVQRHYDTRCFRLVAFGAVRIKDVFSRCVFRGRVGIGFGASRQTAEQGYSQQ